MYFPSEVFRNLDLDFPADYSLLVFDKINFGWSNELIKENKEILFSCLKASN